MNKKHYETPTLINLRFEKVDVLGASVDVVIDGNSELGSEFPWN